MHIHRTHIVFHLDCYVKREKIAETHSLLSVPWGETWCQIFCLELVIQNLVENATKKPHKELLLDLHLRFNNSKQVTPLALSMETHQN